MNKYTQKCSGILRFVGREIARYLDIGCHIQMKSRDKYIFRDWDILVESNIDSNTVLRIGNKLQKILYIKVFSQRPKAVENWPSSVSCAVPL
jgi:hypothetical protein